MNTRKVLIVGAGGMNFGIENNLKFKAARMGSSEWLEINTERGILRKEGDYTRFVVDRIPRGYDVYIIQVSTITEEDVIKLREEEPESWIFFNSAAAHPLTPELTTASDGILRGVVGIEGTLEMIRKNKRNPQGVYSV
jgi:hypothetical protein